jgi:type II secretory pathway component GspD/PulD (secretin)
MVMSTDPRSSRGSAGTSTARPLVACALTCWLASAGAQDLQVIELRYRLAEQVIPALQPLLEPGGMITGMDAMLFVRTSPGNFAQLQQAVSLLDRQSRQLRLTVGQGTVATESVAAVQGSATVGSDDVQVGVNRPPAAATGVAVIASHSSQRTDLRNLSSVTTLEGTEAHIAIGQTTGYRDASTGFYATPRVSGDVVTLGLAPHQQRLTGSPTDRRVATAGLTTQVSGRLGEWIRVGGSSESTRGDRGGLLTWGTRSGEASYSVWVKVEEMP